MSFDVRPRRAPLAFFIPTRTHSFHTHSPAKFDPSVRRARVGWNLICLDVLRLGFLQRARVCYSDTHYFFAPNVSSLNFAAQRTTRKGRASILSHLAPGAK